MFFNKVDGSIEILLKLYSMVPSYSLSMPPNTFNKVDFPTPEGPIIKVNLFIGISKFIFEKIFLSLIFFV